MDERAIVRHTSIPVAQQELDPLAVSEILARSGYFKDARDAAQAAVKVLYGRELGFGPVTSMMGVHIIEGKPSLSANLMAALVKRSGRYNYRVRKSEATGAEIEFFENGESLGLSTFTQQDATAAGLAHRGPWKAYPKAMMFSRAMSQGVRMFCPDLMGGAPAYTPEELGAEVNAETGEIIDVTPQAPANREEWQHRVSSAVAANAPPPPVISGGNGHGDEVKRLARRLVAVCAEASIRDPQDVRTVAGDILNKPVTNLYALDTQELERAIDWVERNRTGAQAIVHCPQEEEQAETLPLETDAREAAGVPNGLTR